MLGGVKIINTPCKIFLEAEETPYKNKITALHVVVFEALINAFLNCGNFFFSFEIEISLAFVVFETAYMLVVQQLRG